METFLLLLGIFVAVVLGSLAGLFIYHLLRSGIKDSNSGGVQRHYKPPVPKPPEDLMLPGSQSYDHVGQQAEEAGLSQTSKPQKTKTRYQGPRRFFDRKDILRAYIADALLDNPKWKERE